MDFSERTPMRLTQVSFIFSLINFFISGFNSATIILFLVFTLAVYSTTKIFVAINQLQHSTHADMSSLSLNLLIAGVLFIAIASFNYSHLFGVFYLVIAVIYLISPYDRAWLAGKSKIVMRDNKIEYREA